MQLRSTKERVVMLLLCCPLAMAATVYRTVDENGVVSFSDTPPEGDAAVESITIDTPQPQSPEAARQRLEDMRMTTDRMVADRREREKHRAEQRELQARSQTTRGTTPDNDYSDYNPVTTSRRIHSRRYYPDTPWRPGYRPDPGISPVHPIVRPPLRSSPDYPYRRRPQGSVNLGSNSQLMRPIVSPRR